MKEELISLKSKIQELKKNAEKFSSEVDSFNSSVKANYAGEEFYADYEHDLFYAAKRFMDENSDLCEVARTVRKEHCGCGEKKFVETVVETMTSANNSLQTPEEIKHKVATYLLFEKAGYNDVDESYNALMDSIDLVDLATKVLVKQTKRDIVNTSKAVVDAVVEFAKPYGDIARDGLDVAADKAKDLVHQGSKKLEKVFGDLAKKTAKPKK